MVQLIIRIKLRGVSGRLNPSTPLECCMWASRITDPRVLTLCHRYFISSRFLKVLLEAFCHISVVHFTDMDLDRSSDGDGECFTVQLDGSDSVPNQKVIDYSSAV